MLRNEADDGLRIVVDWSQDIDQAKQHQQHQLIAVEVAALGKQSLDIHRFAFNDKEVGCVVCVWCEKKLYYMCTFWSYFILKKVSSLGAQSSHQNLLSKWHISDNWTIWNSRRGSMLFGSVVRIPYNVFSCFQFGFVSTLCFFTVLYIVCIHTVWSLDKCWYL